MRLFDDFKHVLGVSFHAFGLCLQQNNLEIQAILGSLVADNWDLCQVLQKKGSI